MTEAEMTAREFTDSELRAIPPIQVGPGHERNPFAKVVGHPVANRNSYRWTIVHGWRTEGDARPVEPSSPEDTLLAALARDKSGFHRAEGPHGFALFPKTATDVAEWERRCIAMHEQQGSITLPDKPVPEFKGFRHLARGS